MAALAELKRVTLVPPGTWEVDPTLSRVCFEVRHLKLLHIRGCFHEVAASISCDSEGACTITASVNVASVDTRDPRRDARLCTQGFFDVDRHPTISFAGQSDAVEGNESLKVCGTATVRAVTRPLELRVEPAHARGADENDELRIRAYGAVSRRDFGLDWDPAFAAGGLVIDDRVTLRFDVVLVRRDGDGS